MELAGNVKKIRVLFRELSLEDKRGAPQFNSVWNCAQTTSPRPRHAFTKSFALAMVMLVTTLCALALWSRNWRRGQRLIPGVVAESKAPSSAPEPLPGTPEPKLLALAESRNRVRSHPWARKIATRRKAERSARSAVIREAVAISSWQSPTATLMQSPADEVLMSVPQLDRSRAELKSFLPKAPK
jgi:hypothetical protein